MSQTGKCVEECSQNEEHGSRNKTRGTSAETGPLDCAQDSVDESAHPIGGEAADKIVEFTGCRADAKEEGHLDEEDEECRGTREIRSAQWSARKRLVSQA